MSMNVFNSSGTAFLGPQPFAFDRAKMLQGLPATFINYGSHWRIEEDVYLPAISMDQSAASRCTRNLRRIPRGRCL